MKIRRIFHLLVQLVDESPLSTYTYAKNVNFCLTVFFLFLLNFYSHSLIKVRFNVKIKPNISNHENTIHKSKAVGKPPLMLALSVWLAIKNAIYNNDNDNKTGLDTPASFEKVFFNLNKKFN